MIAVLHLWFGCSMMKKELSTTKARKKEIYAYTRVASFSQVNHANNECCSNCCWRAWLPIAEGICTRKVDFDVIDTSVPVINLIDTKRKKNSVDFIFPFFLLSVCTHRAHIFTKRFLGRLDVLIQMAQDWFRHHGSDGIKMTSY